MISGETRLAAVIGAPVRHSLSPVIHNAAFASAEIDAVYVAMPVSPGDAEHAVDAMRRFQWLGMSVTMPHKAAVLPAVDGITDAARALRAANCLFWDDDRLMADSTDGAGFVRGLEEELGVVASGARFAVVGAGGAARAVVGAVAAAGADSIIVINRNPVRAEEAVAQAPDVTRVGTLGELSAADVVVNATPLGMAGTDQAGAIPFDVGLLRDDAVVSDLIYHPAETPLLQLAEARGLRAQNGVAMLVFQAAVAFERWTGVEAPVEAMQAAVAGALEPVDAPPSLES